ncbi:hypothetical protein ACWDSJ_02720 [Nocardia sp. NPDC003482]
MSARRTTACALLVAVVLLWPLTGCGDRSDGPTPGGGSVRTTGNGPLPTSTDGGPTGGEQTTTHGPLVPEPSTFSIPNHSTGPRPTDPGTCPERPTTPTPPTVGSTTEPVPPSTSHSGVTGGTPPPPPSGTR